MGGIWITIPTYNEAENIIGLIERLRSVLPDAHIVVVDDNSPDGTAERVKELMVSDEALHLLLRPRKLGYASAIVSGLRYGLERGGEILGHMDADLSHDPSLLPTFLDALQRGADLVIGTRYILGGGVVGWGLTRRLLSRGANFLVRFILQVPIHDATSGFRLYRRDALKRLRPERLRVEGYSFLYLSAALGVWSGLRVVEVPIVFVDRRKGRSKLSRRVVMEAGIVLFKTFWWRQTGRWLGKPLLEGEL